MKVFKTVLLTAILALILSCQITTPKKPLKPMTQEEFTKKHNPTFQELDQSKPILKFDSWEEADQFFKELDEQLNGGPLSKGVQFVEMYIDADPLFYWDEGYQSSNSVRAKSKIYYGCKNIIADIVGDVIFQNFKLTKKNYKIAKDKMSLRVACKGKYEIQTDVHNIGSITSKIVTRTRIWDQKAWPHYTPSISTDFYPSTPTKKPGVKILVKGKRVTIMKKTMKKKTKKKTKKKFKKKSMKKKKR